MDLITDSAGVARLCERLAGADYIAIDTEFLRESTYWPKLCLIQMAGPEDAAAIDPLAEGIDLEPIWALLADPSMLKVFHSARQDIEIFYHLTGQVPAPLFDSQVAAMVCGFGESVSYEKLVAELVGATIDKSSRFTDWSRRPLTDKQIRYALSDVIHLRPAYEALRDRLRETGRESWLAEEMAVLTDPATYNTDPYEAWQRLKTRSPSPKLLAVARELAAWREQEAQARDIPRGRLLRDEALMEIASHQPKSVAELARTRGLGQQQAEGRLGKALLAAVARGLSVPKDERPRPARKPHLPAGLGPAVELLKVLLKQSCQRHHVAQKLVATVGDLELIAAGHHEDVHALKGWRRSVFGEDALRLLAGDIALRLKDGEVEVVAPD
jgi:ribonuclease D